MGKEDDAASRRAVELLTRLNSLLAEESRKAAPHSCLQHITTNQSYIIIVKLALESQHSQVIDHTAQFFHVLINGETEGLLDNKLFSRSLLDLVRYTVTGPNIVVDEETETDLIELLFEVSTKIRLEPDILPAWFHPERDRSRQRLVSDARKSQFPLFFVLVQYVHNDGQAGDFARTGLLYLTETASKSKQLETWMIESDLAPQMASGLGALYSRLSRHFPPLGVSEKTIPILALSDTTVADSDPKQTRESFAQNTKEFLTYLAFWQDTINRCQSQDVEDTLLDHFQVLFVQQLLYPSLLESSDVTGGSTAAVIAHLARILLALEHQALAKRMLSYLLASKAVEAGNTTRRSRARAAISRRKSLDTLTALTEAAESPSPLLFNLRDLITMSLQSKHVNTVNSCLKLVSVILTRHHPVALSALFRVEPANADSEDRSIKAFNATLIKCFDLAAEINRAEDTLDQSYESTIMDAKARIERHSCSIIDTPDDRPLTATALTILSDCKILDALLNKLDTFFLNDTLTNLGLTQCIMDITSCENFVLHGWLLPLSTGTSQRTVLSVIESLVQQLRQWRGFFPEWDALIVRRRGQLEDEEDEPVVVADRSPSGKVASTAPIPFAHSSPPRSNQGSRPVTPNTATRGRTGKSTPKFGSINSTLATSPSPNPQTPIGAKQLAGSPLRKAYLPQDSPLSVKIPSGRSISQSTGPSEEETHQDQLSDEVVEALLKTMITLDIDSGSMPEESSPVLPVHAGRARPGTDSPSLNSDTLGLPERFLGGSGTVTPTPSAIESENQDNKHEVSLSHVLTNAVILQEFILEVAAMIQVRGTMVGDVDLS